jgi:hypothetical protein
MNFVRGFGQKMMKVTALCGLVSCVIFGHAVHASGTPAQPKVFEFRMALGSEGPIHVYLDGDVDAVELKEGTTLPFEWVFGAENKMIGVKIGNKAVKLGRLLSGGGFRISAFSRNSSYLAGIRLDQFSPESGGSLIFRLRPSPLMYVKPVEVAFRFEKIADGKDSHWELQPAGGGGQKLAGVELHFVFGFPAKTVGISGATGYAP